MTATPPEERWAGLDALPDAAVVVDPAGRISYANTATARLVGGDPGLLVGSDAAARLPLADGAGRDWWVCARPLEADPTVAARIPETDLTLFPDGPARPVALTAARWARDPDARLVLCLRPSGSRGRRDERQAELVSALSHDLRSPLTTVKGFAKTLLARDDRLTPDQRREMLAAVASDADRLNRLIGEVVDALRLHAGRLRLRPAPADGAVLTQRALAALPEDRRARVHATPPDRPARVRVDTDRIVGVVLTLLDTALGDDGDADLSAEVDDARLLLRVTAPGADPPVAPSRLFARGLAADRDAIRRWVARGLAEAHGGRIEASGSPGRGLALTLSLPLDVQGTR